jgi:hypothetical protein
MVGMLRRSTTPRRWLRQHGSVQEFDRRELELAGWRTTLDYRENHVRGRDGRLQELRVLWVAVAEHDRVDGPPIVITSSASNVERAWSRLRLQADVALVKGDETVPMAAEKDVVSAVHLGMA